MSVSQFDKKRVGRGLLLAAALASSICSVGLSDVNGSLAPSGQAPSSAQSAARLTLAADLAAASSRTYNFLAEIVGGADNDRSLYCVATTWGFGDGPALTVTPSCAPWTPDTKIQRRFRTSHAYQEPGSYVVTFSYGSLTAQRTVEVR